MPCGHRTAQQTGVLPGSRHTRNLAMLSHGGQNIQHSHPLLVPLAETQQLLNEIVARVHTAQGEGKEMWDVFLNPIPLTTIPQTSL